MRNKLVLLLLAGAAALPLSAHAAEVKANVECTMKFELKGWSVFFEDATGHGMVSCNNGQKADVHLKVQGGGLSFGKFNVLNGTGTFSDVTSLDQIYGGYLAATAEAGAGKSGTASVYTKGVVSLALSGTGQGVDLGFDFGKLEIRPAQPMHERMMHEKK